MTLRLKNTVGLSVFSGDGQEQQLPERVTGEDVLDAPPVPYDGDVVFNTLGWEAGRAELLIVQDKPYPLHVLAAIRKLTTGD